MSALLEWLTEYYSPHEDSGRGLNPERPRWWILVLAAGIVSSAYLWVCPWALARAPG